MTWPDLRVQVAFDSNPLDTGRAWTDITDKTRGVDIDVGRQRELNEYDASTATLTLDNTSRLFDPLHAGGAYYGRLLPGRPVRVGVGYPYLIAQDAPVSYWRFGEPSGITLYDETGLANGVALGAAAVGAASLLNAGSNTALTCGGSYGALCGIHAEHSVDATGELTVEAWVNVTAIGSAQTIAARVTEYLFWVDASGNLNARLYETGGGAYADATSTATLSAGTSYHVAFTWDGTTLRLYIDGVADGTDSSFSGTLQGHDNAESLTVGYRDGSPAMALTGTVDEVAIYGRALTAAELLAHRTEGATGAYDTNLFVGLVDGWPQTYGDDDATDLAVPCTDAFGQLARFDLPNSVYAVEVLADSPRSWWRFKETQGTSLADSSGNNRPAAVTQYGELSGLERRALPIVGDDSSMVLATPSPSGWYIYQPDEYSGMSPSFSIEMWIYNDPPDDSYTNWTWIVAGTLLAGSDFYIYVGDASGTTYQNRLNLEWATILGTGTIRRTSSDVMNQGRVYHVVVTYNGSTFTIYVDGAAVAGSGSYPNPPPTWRLVFNLNQDYSATGTPTPLQTGVGEIACYETALSSARVAAHYNASATPWDGDTSGDRIDRILNELSWPARWTDTDTGQTSLGIADIRGRNALTYIQSVAASEQGQLYVDHHTGRLAFRERHHRLTATRSTTTQQTFTDAGSGGVIYDDATINYDEREIVNECSVEWQGGTATYTDATSVATYGLASRTIRTELASYAEAYALAEWVVGRYRNPTVRVRDITINPAAVADAFPAAITTRIDDRVAFRKLPQGVGSAIEKDLIVEGASHRIGGLGQSGGVNTWTTTLYTSDADAGPWWIAGTAKAGETTRPAW